MKNIKKQNGAITLFVVVTMLFALTVTVLTYLSVSNKLTNQKKQLKKVQNDYNQDMEREYRKTYAAIGNNNIENILTDNDYLIVMASSKSKFTGKTNVGTILEFKNLVDSGTFNYTNVYLYEDIDLDGSSSNKWTPIGTNTNMFSATFDGLNHNITGLYIDATTEVQGLFKANAGTIKNITINGSINATNNSNLIGSIAGVNQGGTILNCTSNVTITGTAEYAGGLIGYNTGRIENCTSNGSVTGKQLVGGIVGGNDGDITGCTNNSTINSTSTTTSTVTAGAVGTGGIAGITSAGTISNSKNLSSINAHSNGVGGIVGSNVGANVTLCYNEGEVQGENGRSRRYSWVSKKQWSFNKLLLQ